MKRDPIQKLILFLATVVVFFAAIYVLYPVASGYFKKEKPKESNVVNIDKDLFKKLEELNDNHAIASDNE